MNALVLTLSNLFSFAGGFVVCRWITMRVAQSVQEAHMDGSERADTPHKPLPGSGVAWLVIGLLFLITGGIGAYATWQNSQTQQQQTQTQDCLRDFITGSVPLSMNRDEAQQQLWDDFATFQHIDPTDKGQVDALRAQFFDDLQVERDAARKLNHYRDTHKPSKACPS